MVIDRVLSKEGIIIIVNKLVNVKDIVHQSNLEKNISEKEVLHFPLVLVNLTYDSVDEVVKALVIRLLESKLVEQIISIYKAKQQNN